MISNCASNVEAATFAKRKKLNRTISAEKKSVKKIVKHLTKFGLFVNNIAYIPTRKSRNCFS